MSRSRILMFAGLAIVVVLAIVAYRQVGTFIEAKVEQRVAQIGLTANEIAANGPLPGDALLYEKELRCSEGISTPGYFSSLNGAEIADAQRSAVFPCATFTGSFDGPNRVFAWRSEATYQGTSFLNNRNPGELFIVGGDSPPLEGPVPPGPYVAKADATTGAQIWRTYLDNANLSGQWIATLNLNILPNGRIVVSWADKIVLLDGDTGSILKANTLPTGKAPVLDNSYKHVTIAPDGTLILKTQSRPAGSTDQGTLAMIVGRQQGKELSPSMLTAVNPDTLEVLHSLQLPETFATPHIITMFEGRIAIYMAGAKTAYRYFWDSATKELSSDQTWVVNYLQEGQTDGDAPTLMGDWVAIQTNGPGSGKAASSMVAINQHDAKKMTTHFPFGPLEPGQFSFAPPKAGGDPENGMIYSSDMGIGKFAAIRFDPTSGEMKVAWTADITSSSFMPLIGPKDKRVLIFTVMKPADEGSIMKTLLTGRYHEKVTWRDAATGRLLAESDFFEPLTLGSLTTPGFGGRIYFPSGKGFIALQVMPKSASSAK